MWQFTLHGSDLMEYFTDCYEKAKALFSESVQRIQGLWQKTSLISHPIVSSELTADIFTAEANQRKKNLFVLISGVHGIEGYTGSALQSYFCHECVNMLNPDETGLVLVHGVNPWGMKHHMRNNEHNVDLNRSFLTDWSQLPENKEYADLTALYQPDKAYRPGRSKCSFYLNFLKKGAGKLKSVAFLGQYHFPDGIYYGGTGNEASSRLILSLYEGLFTSGYENLYLVDLHTGYGPENQMTIVNSPFEKRSTEELIAGFDYSCFTKLSAKDFYAINGDMLDYIYKMSESRFKGNKFFATCFEFGTTGDRPAKQLEALRLNIAVNQKRHHGAINPKAEERLNKQYRELYYPSSPSWRRKAIQDFHRALTGMMGYFEFRK
jgi:hypothetical protein